MTVFNSATPKGGTTPVSPDEERFLKISVSSLEDLNQLERENILEARNWLFAPRRKLSVDQLLDPLFVRDLHHRMFRHIWKWSGKFRDCELNIGVEPASIQQRYFSLMADVKAWVGFGTFPPDEICIRFHHALVVVHPWRNGNGRHARLIADRLAVSFGNPPFTWGGGVALEAKGDTRDLYLAAMKQADRREFARLMAFARG